MVGCAICLADERSDPAFVDGCFHGFCYPCILTWSEAMLAYSSTGEFLRCPICKGGYDSLVHGVAMEDGVSVFSRHCLVHPHRSTHKLALTPAQMWRRKRYSQEFEGDVVRAAGTGRDCTKYLWDWIVREVQALMLDRDVTLVAHLVKGALERLLRTSGRKNLSDMARSPAAAMDCERVVAPLLEPFLDRDSGRFVKEMIKYLATGLPIDAYDRQLQGNEKDAMMVEENSDPDLATSLLYWTDENEE
ncbi:uncharacterized protein LOC112346076 [Selaginella moellendorffii]|uniref:uncharacterized protein LOC112346076 n=1 Tax=Selaginella moellendorffii TaxID=88036 RepID=UPI000D1C76F2|nr:uncharacterized protein LOC112346076 [Selaginella moellendorffii]|eukprot:XP_024529896.1 uncharacterized protein LOC112346076 [Selaginella moellendorffii]